jgi:hypothetical protein
MQLRVFFLLVALLEYVYQKKTGAYEAMKNEKQSGETIHFWNPADIKILINSLISLLYALKRAAHIRIRME